jgi:DNA (cytosine-5)-methyltransferase 3A
MGEKWEKVLSKAIGVNGIHINSALVSAQNRKRIYWTNIGMQPGGLFGDLESIIQQPKDKGILLKDILESEVNEKYFLSDKMIAGFESHKNRHNDKGTGFGYVPKTEVDKGNSLRANAALCPTDNMLIVHNTMPRSSTLGKDETGPLSRNDGKTYCLDTGNTNAIEIVANFAKEQVVGRKAQEDGTYKREYEVSNDEKTKTLETNKAKNNVKIREVKQLSINNKSNGGTQPYQQDRIYDINGISPALQAQLPNGSTMINTSRIRRLTPIECERLQTVKDNYTNYVSDSQRYKMLGNGWTIDVIAHIFNYLK